MALSACVTCFLTDNSVMSDVGGRHDSRAGRAEVERFSDE